MRSRPSPSLPPLIALALGVLIGDLLAPAVATPADTLLLADTALVLLALLARRWTALALLAAGLCAGAALTDRLAPPLASLPTEARVRGVVEGAPRGREADARITAVATPGGAWTPTRGRLRVRFPGAAPPSGTAFLASGTARPFERHGPPGAPLPTAAAARAHVEQVLHATDAVIGGPDPEPPPALVHAGLVSAMAGRAAEVPADEKLRLQRTGTWHLVAVSGLQVGLVAGAAWFLVRWLCAPLVVLWPRGGLRWPAALAAAGAAAAFTQAAGAPPSAVRAAVLAAVAAAARAAGVTLGAWQGLALALCGTLAMDPCAVDHVGFQLSFAAVAGILLWSPRVTRWVPLDAPRLVHALATSLGATLGATIGTLPVVAWQFQSLSPVSPITNLVAAPLLAAVATPAAVAGFALAHTLPEVGALLLTTADTAADLALRVLGPLDLDPWHPAVGAGGAALLTLAALCPRRPGIAAALATAALGLRWPQPPEDDRLVVQFLAIGQGDGAIIDFPDGRVWVVDTGPDPDAMLETLRRQGVTHVDRAVLSHPHPDHDGGLPALLTGLTVDTLVVPRAPRTTGPGAGPSEDAYARMLAMARRVDFAELPAPARLLHPWLGWRSPARDPVNDESLVFRLDFGRRRFLFAGDVEAEGEAELVAHHADALRADVLKVPHHGSRTSSSAPFVAAVDPEVAVISCGEHNRYHHPTAAALAQYRGRRVYRTDLDGTLIVSTDGTDLHVDRADPTDE